MDDQNLKTIERLIEALKADAKDAQSVYDDGIYYLPRGLWVHGWLDFPGLTFARRSLQLDREQLRNGTRYPIQINRVAISIPGNPIAREGQDGLIRNSTSMLNDLDIRVSVPFRQHYSRQSVVAAGIAPKPTSTPPTRAFGESSLWGQNVLLFDRPLIIGRQSGIDWDISSFPAMRSPSGGDGAWDLPPNEDDTLDATMSYFERGGLMQGSARTHRTQIRADASAQRRRDASTPNNLPLQRQIVQAGEPLPFPGGWGAVSYETPARTIAYWDPQSSFPANAFKTKSPVQGGGAQLYGMATAIDQIGLDDYITGAARFPTAKPAPVSGMLGTRVRCRGAVESSWWWRPGIPLNLMLDTVTDAAVYELDVPLTLMPGDSVDVSIDAPASAFSAVDGYEPGLRYPIAVAFNGFTAIEG